MNQTMDWTTKTLFKQQCYNCLLCHMFIKVSQKSQLHIHGDISDSLNYTFMQIIKKVLAPLNQPKLNKFLKELKY